MSRIHWMVTVVWFTQLATLLLLAFIGAEVYR